MGQKASAEATKEQKRRDQMVKDMLKEPPKTSVKILLLGAGESGKTTVFKQMCMLKGGGFDDEYFRSMKSKLCGNVLDGTFHVIKAGKSSGKFSAAVNEACTKMAGLEDAFFKEVARDVAEKDTITQVTPVETDVPIDFISEDLASSLAVLWQDKTYKSVFETVVRDGTTDIVDSYPELMQNLVDNYPEWGGKGWTPGERDILLARVRTTGMEKESFAIDKVTYELIDVGGQRAERRKWLDLFHDVTALLYVASLSEYDQVLFEDSSTNRLVEAIKVFKEVTDYPSFDSAAKLLFLNKYDLFVEKYVNLKIPINKCGHFPDAPKIEDEENGSCELAINWFTKQYADAFTPTSEIKNNIYVHVTCALDGGQMEAAITACTAHILKVSLIEVGLGNMLG